jgi:deferrochelatase/peroxidase EfeB
VRASTTDTARWDRETLGTQEQTVGRFKVSGAGLDLADDPTQLD